MTLGCGETDDPSAADAAQDARSDDSGASDANTTSDATTVSDASDGAMDDASVDAALPGIVEQTVFFSGHQLINLDTPTFFQQLGESSQIDVETEAQINLGSTMSRRLSCPRNGRQADGAQLTFAVQTELVRPSTYDALVVTERGDILSTIPYERTTSMAKRFYDLFLQGNPNGRPFLYESWGTFAAGDGAAFESAVARERVAWDCVASRVNAARSGGQPAMRVLPAATALAELVEEVLAGSVPGMTTLADVFQEGTLLTPKGNYFISVLLYAVILERSPVGLPHTGLTAIEFASPALTADAAARLQTIAWEQAQLAIAESAAHLRTPEVCLPLLMQLCATTAGMTNHTCNTALPNAYGSVTEAVPTDTAPSCLQ